MWELLFSYSLLSPIPPCTGADIWLIFNPHCLSIINSQPEAMASAWSHLQAGFGSWAGLGLLRDQPGWTPEITSQLKLSVHSSSLRMMPFPENKCSCGLLHLFSDTLSVATPIRDMFSQLEGCCLRGEVSYNKSSGNPGI